MKKRAWLYAILIAVSGTLVTWLFLLENEGTTRPQLYDFTVEDTASVDRITIRDKRPMETVLTRTRDGWRVNGGYLARPDAIEILLETLKRQEMRSFAPEKAKKRVLNMMSTRGTEVIVEAEGEVVKHFYVGGNAPDLLGTYMMIRGSDGPYQVHIPGFNGFLNTRYFADPNMWRNRTLVSIDAENIERISLEYHHDPEAGLCHQAIASWNRTCDQLARRRETRIRYCSRARVFAGIPPNLFRGIDYTAGSHLGQEGQHPHEPTRFHPTGGWKRRSGYETCSLL